MRFSQSTRSASRCCVEPDMKIRTKERLLTGLAATSILMIAATIWWAYAEVAQANRQRQQASEIVRSLTRLRLLTFEFHLNHSERTRAQWNEVSRTVDRVIALTEIATPIQERLLAGMRERRLRESSLFAEFSATTAGSLADAPLDPLVRRFEALLLNGLMAGQQENLSDVFRLIDIASARIDAAHRDMTIAIVAGLLLVTAIKLGTSWMVNRDLLAPIVRIQHATREVALGRLHSRLGMRRNDEIGELSANFDAMTQSLRTSFTRIEHDHFELAALNKELEAFSYSVSHDLRSPLRSIDGFSLALLEDYGDKLDDEGKGFINRIRAATQRMGQLIDDLLGLSKVTRAELRLQSVDLGAMAKEIATALQNETPSRAVDWIIDDGLTMHADSSLMRIALFNLLENAWKFTARTPVAVIRIGARQQEGKRVFFVADNGAGFDMAYADKLFAAFQRLHLAGDFPGTGIGLAIVRRVISRHKGDIWAEARNGEGASFFFTIGDLEELDHGQDHPAC